MAELSPMMQQYLEIKKQHKDEILFYRIGDFYEMFFDDALTVSRELDLTLTGKQCGLEERAPMCGVPFHSYEGYVARLISKGYKVAICEQMEDPAKAKGLVKRDIIRVVTPGTVIESSMLQDDKNNYIASIFLKGGAAGLCFADVSTGTAHITELKREKIAPAVIAELCRYHPSEVLMNRVCWTAGKLPLTSKRIWTAPSSWWKRSGTPRASWPSPSRTSLAATGPQRPASQKTALSAWQWPLCWNISMIRKLKASSA